MAANDRPPTLRPPAPGNVETVSLPRPPEAVAQDPLTRSDPPPLRPSSIPPRAIDPRADGPGVYAERVLASVDALGASVPDPPPPDRQQRIEALVRELVSCAPDADLPVRQRLLALGPEVVPLLRNAFPGALWVDVARPHRPLRSARQVSPVAAALADFGEATVPHLPPLMRASRPELRLVAVLVAADLASDELVAPVAARLWDDVPVVRNAACVALEASADLPAARVLRSELLGTLRDPRTPEKWRKKAVWTLGQMRDAESVPLIVDQLGAEPGVAKIARRSLALLVGRDLGRFRVRWQMFLRKNGERSRVEWLIDALDQPNAEARMHVADELVFATGEGFDRRLAATTREGARELADFYRELAR